MTGPENLHHVVEALEAKLEIVARERSESVAALEALETKLELVARERTESVAAARVLVDEQARTFVELSELRRRLSALRA
jgi:hypothetical protein